MLDRQARRETSLMYYCLKCDHRHREMSSIGRWHASICLPELRVSGSLPGQTKRRRPPHAVGAALVALYLSGREERIRETWADQFPDADPMEDLRTARNEFHTVGFSRWSGHNRVTLLTTNDHGVRQLAREYESRGISWGAWA
jgi:hypothetical protein